MSAFPKTRAAAGYVASHGPSDLARTQAAVLLKWLEAGEAAMTGADGSLPVTAHGILRSVVLATRDLAGPGWLAVRNDDPDIAAFTALETTPRPPAPADLDEIISRVLWARFGPDAGRPRLLAAQVQDEGDAAPGSTSASCPVG